MKTSTNGRILIKKHEGFRQTAYLDPAGLLTVGVGHLITEKEKKQGYVEVGLPEWGEAYKLFYNMSISGPDVESLLTQDLRRFEYFVDTFIRSCNPGMSQDCFDGLVSFAFNIGTDNFRNSDSYELLRSKLFITAAEIIFQWHKITINGEKKPLPGLVNRRIEEIRLILGHDFMPEYWEKKRKDALKG